MLAVCGPRFEYKVLDGMCFVGRRYWLRTRVAITVKEVFSLWSYQKTICHPYFMLMQASDTVLVMRDDFFRASASWGRRGCW